MSFISAYVDKQPTSKGRNFSKHKKKSGSFVMPRKLYALEERQFVSRIQSKDSLLRNNYNGQLGLVGCWIFLGGRLLVWFGIFFFCVCFFSLFNYCF